MLWEYAAPRITEARGATPVRDVPFALAGTLMLLPPLIVWADQHRWPRILPWASVLAGPPTDMVPRP